MKLAAKELRASEPGKADIAKIKRRDIYIICDNILDTYNIGSIFRLADAVGAKGVYLCGSCQTPPYHRIAKAAVGTEKWVSWKYYKTATLAIKNLKLMHSQGLKSKIKNLKVIAIEQHPKAKDFRNVNYELSTTNHKQSFSANKQVIAFVIGHETDGVSKEALALCDEIVEIPMFGVNISLNVMVSLAIVLFNSLKN